MLDPLEFFREPSHPLQRRYEALRAYFFEGRSAAEAARRFHYSAHSLEVLASQFRQGQLPPFFRDIPHGRKDRPVAEPLREAVLRLRHEENLSVIDIAERLRSEGRPVSFHTVWLLLREAGVGRLPRRTAEQRNRPPLLAPPVSDISQLHLRSGVEVECRTPLVFLFAPFLDQIGFDQLVRRAHYPSTSMIPAPAYLRSLLALKLLSRPRHNHVMPIADDEGLGWFAGLNVLPKTTALSDYSYRIGDRPHRALLRGLVRARKESGAYPTDSFNLDFHTIRHYGDPHVSRLEKDYVPRRSQSVPAVVSAFAQEWEGREMVYARANLLKEEKADEVVRFVEYWKEVDGKDPGELVFDAHMTTHAGLAELDRRGIKFLTLRERRSREVERIRTLPEDQWKSVELKIEDRAYRHPKVVDERVEITDYPGRIRQVAALNLGREEPTLLLTNDARRGPAELLTRYARRTLIENSLGEQVHFFHVDALSSSVRVKVDLDVVLSVAASAAYRWLASQLKGYETATARTIWERFLDRPGKVSVGDKEVVVKVRRFSRAPVLLDAKVARERPSIPWLGDRRLRIEVTGDLKLRSQARREKAG
ncbi:MAG: hypothetical protein ACREDE_04160 [Thermoplasmata archaeon]